MNAPIPFRGFDERGTVRIYRHGLLPHWRQAGCTYFVTFRLADALPRAVLREFEYQRGIWLRRRGIDPAAPDAEGGPAKLSTADRRQYERWAAATLNRFLDVGHGTCLLRRPDLAAAVADALTHFHGDRALTGDFVVMPNHAHALLTPLPGHELEDVLHAVKSFTANRINRLAGRTGGLWQKESYDHIVRDTEQLGAFQAYIRANPAKAKLGAGEFLLSEASYTVAP